MPRYKLADVVLDITGIEERRRFCRWPTRLCWPVLSWCWPWHTCYPIVSWCRPIRSTIWWEIEIEGCPAGSILDIEHMFDEWDDPRELERLRVQLKTVLEHADRRQETLGQEMQPQTMDELNVLEEQLKAAQADLARRKKDLSG